MNITIEESIKRLQEEIKEKEKQIKLIKNINNNQIVTEQEWHEICETPLRNSNLLEQLVKNIFPDAENIQNYVNYVYFDLLGFRCAIPTSLCQGIYIDVKWYLKDTGKPNNIYSGSAKIMKKYFDAIDNKDSWYTCAKLRLNYRCFYKKWVLFLLWFGKYKWKDDRRKEWEIEFQKQEENFQYRLEEYHNERKQMHDKVVKMHDELIPRLNNFSNQIYKLEGWYSIEDIFRFENIK